MSNCVVKYEKVTIKYGKHEVVKDISFEISKNDFLNVIGPNGAGKTTLIKSLIGQVKVFEGTIYFDNQSIGYVPQKQTIKRNFPLTVLEFIYTGFKQQKLIISQADKDLIVSWLDKMELEREMLHHKISYLSGGELQRIYLIRSLIAQPEILILDEPASALDPSFREKFYDILNDIREKEKITIIHITHDLTDIVLKNSKVMYIDRDIKFFGNHEDYHHFEHEGHRHG